jgi:N6-L-threonylcarbamoyladenine synthase
LLGLGYPGGPIIDRLAAHGDAQAVKFQASQIKHRDRRDHRQGEQGERAQSPAHVAGPDFDFSYSGIKTGVLRYVETHDLKPSIAARRQALAGISWPTVEDLLKVCDRQTLNLVASFQWAMVSDLLAKTLSAAREYDVRTLFVSGGVAANRELRNTFGREAAMQGLPVFFPSHALSTDNAAMIAAAAYPKFLRAELVAMDFSAEAGMALR